MRKVLNKFVSVMINDLTFCQIKLISVVCGRKCKLQLDTNRGAKPLHCFVSRIPRPFFCLLCKEL